MLERVLTNCRLPRKYGSLLCWFMLAFHRQHSHWNRWCSSTVVHGTGMNMLTLWSIQRTRVKMLNACRSNSVTWKKNVALLTSHTHRVEEYPPCPFTVWSYFSPLATRNAPSFPASTCARYKSDTYRFLQRSATLKIHSVRPSARKKQEACCDDTPDQKDVSFILSPELDCKAMHNMDCNIHQTFISHADHWHV